MMLLLPDSTLLPSIPWYYATTQMTNESRDPAPELAKAKKFEHNGMVF
jgi:hypothetical protein